MVLESQTKNCAAYRTDWPEMVAAVAGPFSHRDTRESWLNRAAHRSGLSLRLIKSLFYGEITDPKDSVATKLRIANEKAQAASARLEALALASRFETIAQGLQNADENYHSETVSKLVDVAGRLRGLDRA